VSTKKLGFTAIVPGNAGRFFSNYAAAVAQPRGLIEFGWDELDPYIFNASFNESLIKYDTYYCTSLSNCANQRYIETEEYFSRDILPTLPKSPRVVEIGCGQGEFCDWLLSSGLEDVRGYDPVLRQESKALRKRFWSADEHPADLFVMRCVLPHLARPWDFLHLISENSPGCKVLVEYQSLEWIIRHQLWYQFSHDHVNQFRVRDFLDRFRVLLYGQYAAGEWEWVLFEPSSYREPKAVDPNDNLLAAMSSLKFKRNEDLAEIIKQEKPVAVWGAAGKGTVLSYAITEAFASPGGGDHGRTEIRAIDSDSSRWDQYLECSGVHVLSPKSAIAQMSKET
jgi:hypothetical protein